MQLYNANGEPVLFISGSLANGGNYFNTVGNFMILDGFQYILNSDDNKWYKVLCKTENGTPVIYLDDTGITRGF